MLTPEKDPPRNAGDKLAGFPTDPYTPSQYGYRNVPNVTNRGLSDANYVGVNTQTGLVNPAAGVNFDVTFNMSGKQFYFSIPSAANGVVTDYNNLQYYNFEFYFNDETSPIIIPALHFACYLDLSALLVGPGMGGILFSGKAFSKVRVLIRNNGVDQFRLAYVGTAFEEPMFIGKV